MGADQPSLLEVINEIDDKSTRQAGSVEGAHAEGQRDHADADHVDAEGQRHHAGALAESYFSI